jgi:hypothetical protein
MFNLMVKPVIFIYWLNLRIEAVLFLPHPILLQFLEADSSFILSASLISNEMVFEEAS